MADIATALIWVLRLILPIVLFWFYFKLNQSPKEDGAVSGSPSLELSGHVHSREECMRVWKVVARAEKPECMANLTVVGEDKAPHLFAGPSGRAPRGGAGARRENVRDRALQADRERGDRRRERGERSDRGDRGDRAGRSENSEKKSAPAGRSREVMVSAASSAPQDPSSMEPGIGEETKPGPGLKVQEDSVRKRGLAACSEDDAKQGFQICTQSSDAANRDAQDLLERTSAAKRADVSTALYEQLVASQIVISEKTLTLMIEAFISANDLKSASDFLVKMDHAGFTPATDLLDRVMDLHSLQKSKREQEKEVGSKKRESWAEEDPSWEHADLSSFISQDAEVEEQTRPKLSSNARIFVPMAAVAPEEFSASPPSLEETVACTATKSMEGEPTQEQAPARTPLRTALRTGARSFISKENAQFDPMTMPTWAPEFVPQEGAFQGQGAFIPMDNMQFEPNAMPTWAPEFVPQEGAFQGQGAFIPMENAQFEQSTMPTWVPEFVPQEGAFIPMENMHYVPMAVPAMSPEFVPQQGAPIPMENRIWAPENVRQADQ